MSSTTSFTITAVTMAVALAIALLTWSLFDIGTRGLARYRQMFTAQTNFSSAMARATAMVTAVMVKDVVLLMTLACQRGSGRLARLVDAARHRRKERRHSLKSDRWFCPGR